MKILYVITQSDSIGGASLHVLDLAAGMQTAGHEVILLAGGNGQLAEYAARRGIEYHALRHLVREISPVHDILAVRELAGQIRALAPDVVHLHSSKAGIIGRLAARRARVPNVFTAHGWAFTEGVSPRRRSLYRHIEKYCATLADRIITVSEYDRQLAISLGVARPEQIVTVHNGVHDTPRRKATDAPASDDSAVHIIMVARFQSPKDQAAVIRALADMPQRSWTLSLVGDGPTQAQAQALAASLGVANQVHFPGSCEDIPDRLAVADIFVLASAWEGLPLSIIEAMRAGLPVVASDVGGVSELVAPERTGLLVPRGDVAGLGDALARLIASPAQRTAMGTAGRQLYEQQFAFEPMRDRTLAIYRQVCGLAPA